MATPPLKLNSARPFQSESSGDHGSVSVVGASMAIE